MTDNTHLQLAQKMYKAFSTGDRTFVEELLTDDLVFSSPIDVGLDLAGYFKRCWPGAGSKQNVDFVRLIESGDEVVITYEMQHPDGSKGRNTEVLTFRDNKICAIEVYFGWNIPKK